MRKKREINPEYYEKHDFAEDLAEAKKKGTLIVSAPGESAIDAIKRHTIAQKKGGGSFRATAVPLAAKSR